MEDKMIKKTPPHFMWFCQCAVLMSFLFLNMSSARAAPVPSATNGGAMGASTGLGGATGLGGPSPDSASSNPGANTQNRTVNSQVGSGANVTGATAAPASSLAPAVVPAPASIVAPSVPSAAFPATQSGTTAAKNQNNSAAVQPQINGNPNPYAGNAHPSCANGLSSGDCGSTTGSSAVSGQNTTTTQPTSATAPMQ
jgi:hypothetical protein